MSSWIVWVVGAVVLVCGVLFVFVKSGGKSYRPKQVPDAMVHYAKMRDASTQHQRSDMQAEDQHDEPAEEEEVSYGGGSIIGGIVLLTVGVVVMANVFTSTMKNTNTTGWTTGETSLWSTLTIVCIVSMLFAVLNIFGL